MKTWQPTPKLFTALLVISIACSMLAACATDQVGSGGTPVRRQITRAGAPWPVISLNAPAFASNGYYPASDADDDSYDTAWRSQGTPAWLSYDLSRVPVSERGKVLVVWYNESYDYDHTIINNYSYNMPEDYTIAVNAAAGGGKPPASGWQTVSTVTGNHYHSRQQVIDMAGANWIRMAVTKADGAPENYDININMDVYDARSAVADDWIFFGDSISAGAMGHLTLNGVPSFAQLINAHSPDHFPIEEAGATAYLTSADGAKHIATWLPLFPGKYVGLSYGTNDALGCINPSTFYDHYITMVKAVLQAGKIPIISHIPWGRMPDIQRCAPALNAQIDSLYTAFPQIIKGPDFWAYFQSHQSQISNDNIHPTSVGFSAYRQQWADAMLTEVYQKSIA